MRFRPCIDLHGGIVKQIVGATLSDIGPRALETNFQADRPARQPKVPGQKERKLALLFLSRDSLLHPCHHGILCRGRPVLRLWLSFNVCNVTAFGPLTSHSTILPCQ